MKKKLYKEIYCFLLFSTIASFLLLSSCKNDEDNMRPPVITEIRNYDASPNDTVVTTLQTGQWIVLLGKNLDNAKLAFFGSTQATINTALTTSHSIVVQVPTIPFQSIPRDKINEITLVNKNGIATTFTINITGAPIISYVRNYTSAPEDTVIGSVSLDQQINLIGFNLRNVTSISFQGVEADLTNVIYTDSSAIVTVPHELSGGDATLINTISFTTIYGTASFSITIIGGPPLVTGVSYELPLEGDVVYLYGSNLFEITEFTFAGATISSFEGSADGTWIKFKAPQLTKSGPVIVKNFLGTFTTAYNVNDIDTGILSNYQGTFRWNWWGGASLGVPDASLNDGWITVYPEFSGNPTKFLVLNTPVQKSGDGADWTTAIRMTDDQAASWFPSLTNLDDPAKSWALKFEIKIPQNWEGSSVVIKTSNGDYMVRYEPWQISPSKTAPYKTNGWQTVTIPLTSFRKNDGALGDGKGAPITTVKELFSSNTTTSNLLVYIHNYGASDTKTGFKGAFDNFRVVKR